MRFIFLTIDGNHAAALRLAADRLRREHGLGLTLSIYDAASLRNDADWQRLAQDIAGADFVFGARLFGEEMVRPLERLLMQAACPVCVITSNPALISCTHLGRFDLRKNDNDQEPGIIQQWVKKLRPHSGAGEAKRQLAVLRNLTKVLKLIPGKARDIYVYAVAIQYWTNCSPENLYRLLCLLADRYVAGQQGRLPVLDPLNYPEAALFHPAAPEPFETTAAYEQWRKQHDKGTRGHGDTGTTSIPGTAKECQSPCPRVSERSERPCPPGRHGRHSLATHGGPHRQHGPPHRPT